MKIYPLEVDALYSDGSICGYYSKGHHDPALFVEAIKDWNNDLEIAITEVKHDWRRWEICCGIDEEWIRCLNIPRDGTTRRGVFPVTIVEWL